MKRVLNYYIVI